MPVRGCGYKLVSGQSLERGVVVRLVLDFRDQFAMDDAILGVENHHGTCGNAGQRTGSNLDTLVLEEVAPAHGRQADNVGETFCAAETLLGERQVG